MKVPGQVDDSLIVQTDRASPIIQSDATNPRAMHIRIDNLAGPEIHELLGEHLCNMALHSPPESIHALDIEALRKPGITFWTAWDGDSLLG